MGGIQPEHERSAGPVRANPAEQVGAARQRTDHRWRTRRRWVGGVNAMGRGGDPGVPGVRQGGGTGDPGSGERWRQRGTIGAPRQEGAQDPAGQGAAPVTRQAREEGLDLLLQQPFRGRAGHSILRVSRSFHDHDTDGSARAFGGTETVDNLPANPPPFNPVWEKGVGGMRGKGARECRTLLISPKHSTLESAPPGYAGIALARSSTKVMISAMRRVDHWTHPLEARAFRPHTAAQR
jgi:hypothetical protein